MPHRFLMTSFWCLHPTYITSNINALILYPLPWTRLGWASVASPWHVFLLYTRLPTPYFGTKWPNPLLSHYLNRRTDRLIFPNFHLTKSLASSNFLRRCGTKWPVTSLFGHVRPKPWYPYVLRIHTYINIHCTLYNLIYRYKEIWIYRFRRTTNNLERFLGKVTSKSFHTQSPCFRLHHSGTDSFPRSFALTSMPKVWWHCGGWNSRGAQGITKQYSLDVVGSLYFPPIKFNSPTLPLHRIWMLLTESKRRSIGKIVRIIKKIQPWNSVIDSDCSNTYTNRINPKWI